MEIVMRDRHTEELRLELDELFRKQYEVLESRMLGTASDAEVLEYEIRQEIIHQIIHELCNGFSHSAAA
jgi:outer membrane lipopolysaccharide assembly protein LptE/RlpB